MKTFKIILRAMLFLLVLSIYYIICISIIIIKGNPDYGDNMGLNILMICAVASPFLVVRRVIKWLSPFKESRVFPTIISLLIIVGMIFHYIGAMVVDHNRFVDFIPAYTFHFFIAICLMIYMPPKKEPIPPIIENNSN